jgi:transcription-repair coupling factor (superfamily II helicase)
MTTEPLPTTPAALASRALAGELRLDVAGAVPSVSALVVRELHESLPKERVLVLLTATSDEALDLAGNVTALLPGVPTLVFPTIDGTPFDGVRVERHLIQTRVAALDALGRGAVRVLIVPAAGFARKVIPRSLLDEARVTIRTGEPLDLREASTALERIGYVRTPLVEDEGSFAVRGSLLDVWPASSADPLRIEVDFDTALGIIPFDPETQERRRDSESLKELVLPLARDVPLTEETKARARSRMQELADELHIPTRKARALFDEVLLPASSLGSEALLPAFAELVPLSEYLGPAPLYLLVEPASVLRTLREVKDAAFKAHLHKQGNLIFPVEAHFASDEWMGTELRTRQSLFLSRVTVFGSDDGSLESLAFSRGAEYDLKTQDNRSLAAALERSRSERGESPLAPLKEAIAEYTSEGYTVILCARTAVQAERLKNLLSHRGVELKDVASIPRAGGADFERAGLFVGPVSSGFAAPALRLVLITEQEIFGKRAQRAARKSLTKLKASLDDLRSLTPGDYVIHREHGVGRYLGLEHRNVGGSTVDFFVVEYQGKDKLYVPVYRLNQIQKHAGGDTTPKLDRLGGQTFEKAKARAKKRARDMADQLLRLYAERLTIERPPLPPPGDDYAAFEAEVPFEETPDQAEAIADVQADLSGPRVMDRLVSGDVGFGKTEVALRAAYRMALDSRQTALLCPTTVLAEQHYRTFEGRLGHLGVQVAALSRFTSTKEASRILTGLKSGAIDIVIGTHRLLSSDVHFKQLGLLVIDEEQRFGVAHKERIKDLRKSVDVLTLSATPIPRTLSLAIGGLRDMSVIRTPPETRRAIRTFVAGRDPSVVKGAIERELARGGQVYYVHNRIEELYARASELHELVPDARIRVAHGQMSDRELEKTMLEFVDGNADILAATAIIESGLDIPRANTIFIERADNFGLAQLYQIRGRVGRGSERAYCYLLVPPPSELSHEANLRLEALTKHTELGAGFQIATLDMEMRGAGDLLGADQSGVLESVGFELFSEMLEQASSELSGHGRPPEVDPELSVDVEALLPDDYISDVGVRLSLYKRLAGAPDEEEIDRIGLEMTDRFGAVPRSGLALLELMRLKVSLRRLMALGMNATKSTATLHLRADTPLSPERLVPFISAQKERYSLSPDGSITRRSSATPFDHGLAHASRMLDELAQLVT